MICAKDWDQRARLEVLLRESAVIFLAFALAVPSLPRAIPTAFKYLVGQIGAALAISLPKQQYAVFVEFPMIVNVLVLAMAASTALLAASAVSDGLFVSVFAVLTFVLTGLYFGKNFSMTSSVTNALISSSAMLALSFRPLLQQAIEEGASASKLLRQLWLQSGLENPAAVYQNFLVAIGWTLLVLSVGYWIPPIRTSRESYIKYYVPSSLGDVKGLLESSTNDDEGEVYEVVFRALHGNLHLAGGAGAQMSLFEPRCCAAPCVPELKGLLVGTSHLVGAALASKLSPPAGEASPSDEEEGTREEEEEDAAEAINNNEGAVEMINRCSEALLAPKREQMERMERLDETLQQKAGADSDTVKGSRPLARLVDNQCRKVGTAVVEWTKAYRASCGDYSPAGRAKTAEMYSAATTYVVLSPVLGALSTIRKIFTPKSWRFVTFWYMLKLSVGFVALFAMSVYWPAYSSFAIQIKDYPVGAVFSGWHLTAYAFSWQPTREGTVKKGLQRLLGTALGGLFAYLGVLACSNGETYNEYGLVAWLTVFSIFAAALSVEEGYAAFEGSSRDHGYTGMYFATNLALFLLEAYSGKGDERALIANRLAANLVGVAMSMFLASIPPCINGADPKHYNALLESIDDAFKELTRNAKGNDDGFDWSAFETSFLADFNNQRKKTVYWMNDADKLRMLPFLRVDTTLRSRVECLVSLECMLQLFLHEYSSSTTSLKENFAAYLGGPDSDDAVADEALQELKALYAVIKEVIGKLRSL